MGKVKKNFFIIFLILVLGVNFAFGYEIVSSVKIPASRVSVWSGNVYDENNNLLTGYSVSFLYLYQVQQNSIIDTIELQRKTSPLFIRRVSRYPNTYIQSIDVFEAILNNNVLKLNRKLGTFDFSNPDLPRLYCGSSYYIYPTGYHFDCSITSSGVFEFKYITDNPYIQTQNNYLIFKLNFSNDFDFIGGFDYLDLLYRGEPTSGNDWFTGAGLNNLLNFYGSIKIYTQLIFPSGFNFNVNDYNNNLVFKIFSVNEFNNIQNFNLEVIDDFTGQILYNSGIRTANISITPNQLEEKTLYLPDYGIDLKQVLTDLKNNFKTNLKLRLTLYLTGSGGQAIIIDEVNLVLQGFQVVGQTYQDWYNSIIGSFGLSEATPTPIFKKSAEFIDKTFQTFQSFITINNDKLNNLKASIIDNLNTFISYINGFTDALGFLKYLFYGLLVFTMIEFIIKFGRLIIPFK
jgi:hypothetical protein